MVETRTKIILGIHLTNEEVKEHYKNFEDFFCDIEMNIIHLMNSWDNECILGQCFNTIEEGKFLELNEIDKLPLDKYKWNLINKRINEFGISNSSKLYLINQVY